MSIFKTSTKDQLESFVSNHWNELNKYLDDKFNQMPTPIYSSVDIREGVNKFAPVDHNFYPAGFNNLCNLDLNNTGKYFNDFIKTNAPEVKTVGILTESHTKNLFYLDHLISLGNCLIDEDYDIKYISFDNSLFTNGDSLTLTSQSKLPITIHKATSQNSGTFINNQEIDFIIMNNDQSQKINIDFNEIQTPVHPSPTVGWYQREKNHHFSYYRNVVNDFCEYFSINPDLIQAKFKSVNHIDFSTKEGLDKLSSGVDELKQQLSSEQKIFIKASKGTYGMGISVVNSGEEVVSMNRKKRNKMDIGKNKIKFKDVLIQEGIDTIIKYDDIPAEITIYLVNGHPVGGFMRANPEKTASCNLNSRGMIFKKYCISEIREGEDHNLKEAVYSIVARLSTLASTFELAGALKQGMNND